MATRRQMRNPPARHRVRALLLSTVIDREAVAKVVDKQLYGGATAIIFELEIGVPASRKALARELARECLATVDYGDHLRGVRINPLESRLWEDDLKAIMPARPDAIMLAKVYDSSEIEEVAHVVNRFERTNGFERGSVRLWSMIETAKAMLHSEEIASAHPRLDTLVFGPGDYTREIGTFTSTGDESWGINAGIETFYARSHMLAAARAAGRYAIDMCFPDVRKLDTMPAHARLSRQMGFDGMLALSPNQLPAIIDGFTPSLDEVEKAKRIVAAFKAAAKKDLGIVAVDGLHVSETVADAYQMVLDRAGYVAEATPQPPPLAARD